MNVDRNIKLPDLNLSAVSLSKIDIGLELVFPKKVRFWNSVVLKFGVALEFSL